MALSPTSSHPPSGGSGVLLTATLTLTNADIRAFPATTPVIVAPPGAGKLLRFVSGYLAKDFTAGAYTNIDAASAATYFVYDTVNEFDQASRVMNAQLTGQMLGQANVRQADFPIYTNSDLSPVQSGLDLTNTNIGFQIDNGGSGAFTGGNAANTLRLFVYYVLITL